MLARSRLTYTYIHDIILSSDFGNWYDLLGEVPCMSRVDLLQDEQKAKPTGISSIVVVFS
jgi:hypothetical protein